MIPRIVFRSLAKKRRKLATLPVIRSDSVQHHDARCAVLLKVQFARDVARLRLAPCFAKSVGRCFEPSFQLIASVAPDFERRRSFWSFSKTIIAIGIIVAAVLTLSAVEQVYILRQDPGTTVFFKRNEAYLLLWLQQYWLAYELPAVPRCGGREYFYAPPIPADERVAAMVIRVAPSGVERFHLEYGKEPALAPSFLTPFEDSFYAMCPAMTLCKWSGNEFIPATQEEQQRFGGLNNLSRGNINNHIINGWSVREVRSSPGDHFEIQLGNGFSISADNRATDIRQQPSISVVLLRPGQARDVLYEVDGSPRRVSRAEYVKAFGRL